MNRIQVEYFDWVEYTLRHESTKEVVIPEPIGWEEDSKEIQRDPKAHGKRIKTTSNLEFPYVIAEGKINPYEWILDIFKQFGINAIVTLRKYVLDPSDPDGNKKGIEYELVFDYSTMKVIDDEKGRRIQIKSKDEGIGQVIINRLNEEVEIERITTLDGVSLPALNYETVELQGKKIFLDTQMSVVGGLVSNVPFVSSRGDRFGKGYPIPLEIEFKSTEDVLTPIPQGYDLGNSDGTGPGLAPGQVGMLFYTNSRSQTISLNLEIFFTGIYGIVDRDSPYSNPVVRLDLVVYSDVGNTTAFKNRQIVKTIAPNTNNQQVSVLNSNKQVVLEEGDGIAFIFYTECTLGGRDIFNDTGRFDVNLHVLTSTIRITESSFFPATNARFILSFELGQRLAQILTNQVNDVFRSNFLGRTDIGYNEDGPGGLTGVTTGLLIRGFTNTDFSGSDVKDKRFKTTMKNFLDTFNALWNTGWSVERNGLNEYIRVEEIRYFYQNVVTIKLPLQATKVTRSVANEYYFSTIDVGNKNVLEPEEVMALDEPNTQSKYTTVITRLENKLNLLHPYDTSIYNKEFARRKQKKEFPLEDTKYDLVKFILDLKRGVSSVFQQRKWQDDFSVEPKGIFDPDSATELRFTPANTLLRSAWRLRVGLEKYLNQFTRYASTDGNSNLLTQMFGKSEVSENGNFRNSTFEIPRFLPEIIEFEHEVDFSILKQVEGKTTKDDGEVIENFYGLVQFINEKNELEFGYLLNLKPNKQGKWKLLKANR